MLTQTKIIEILRRELPDLKANFGVKRMGIFGSFVKGLQREDSDVDILTDFEKPIGLEFIEFAEHIEELLNRKVDILTSGSIKNIRIKEVAREIERTVVYV